MVKNLRPNPKTEVDFREQKNGTKKKHQTEWCV